MTSIDTFRDTRSLSHETLEEIRRLAVRRVLNGEKHADVAKSLEVQRTTVSKWMMAYRAGGDQALASTKAQGPQPKLTQKQLDRLRRLIVEKNPMQLKFSYALWTISIVGDLITREFGVVYHASTVSRLLGRMGLTPQVPTRRSFKRDDDECRQWVSETFPAIVREARRRQAVLLFSDEAGVNECGPVGTTWAERGKTPLIHTRSGYDRVNVISAISPGGRMWFRCFRGKLNATLFCEFLDALMHDIKGDIYLIIDRHPAHTAVVTRRFIEDHKKRLRVASLPKYAPDMNPDEHVWSYLKGLFRREPLSSDENISDAVEASMQQIKADRKLVKDFFKHPAVAYVKQALKW